MNYNIIIIDNNSGNAISVTKPSEQQLQALEDCEEYTIIDPLNHGVYINGAWEPIPTGAISQDNNIVMVR